jgi:hypothetical protein
MKPGSPPATANLLDDLMNQLRHLPLWMKQVVYTEMKVDLEASISKNTLDSFERDHCLQLMIPYLSIKGSQEYHQPTGRYPQAMKDLLTLGYQGMNVAGICVSLQWTLEQCSGVLLKAYQSDLLVPCPSPKIEATIRYLANETRLGEYLVQVDKLTWTQLEQAVNTQQYIQDVLGEKTGMGDVLINLGFVTRQDSESILFLKEESKKAFIVNKGIPLYLGQTAVGPNAAEVTLSQDVSKVMASSGSAQGMTATPGGQTVSPPHGAAAYSLPHPQPQPMGTTSGQPVGQAAPGQAPRPVTIAGMYAQATNAQASPPGQATPTAYAQGAATTQAAPGMMPTRAPGTPGAPMAPHSLNDQGSSLKLPPPPQPNGTASSTATPAYQSKGPVVPPRDKVAAGGGEEKRGLFGKLSLPFN